MTYHGVVLQVSGYHADEKYIINQYSALLAKWVHQMLSFLVFHLDDPLIQNGSKVPRWIVVVVEQSE